MQMVTDINLEAGLCTSCYPGYKLTGAKKCLACSAEVHCLTCKAADGEVNEIVCESCESGMNNNSYGNPV